MGDDEKINLAGKLALMDEKLDHIHNSLCSRVKFVEKIVFGFVGMLVVGLLVAIGDAVLWIIQFMGLHKGG